MYPNTWFVLFLLVSNLVDVNVRGMMSVIQDLWNPGFVPIFVDIPYIHRKKI